MPVLLRCYYVTADGSLPGVSEEKGMKYYVRSGETREERKEGHEGEKEKTGQMFCCIGCREDRAKLPPVFRNTMYVTNISPPLPSPIFYLCGKLPVYFPRGLLCNNSSKQL
jgi:hypothetical protein